MLRGARRHVVAVQAFAAYSIVNERYAASMCVHMIARHHHHRTHTLYSFAAKGKHDGKIHITHVLAQMHNLQCAMR